MSSITFIFGNAFLLKQIKKKKLGASESIKKTALQTYSSKIIILQKFITREDKLWQLEKYTIKYKDCASNNLKASKIYWFISTDLHSVLRIWQSSARSAAFKRNKVSGPGEQCLSKISTASRNQNTHTERCEVHNICCVSSGKSAVGVCLTLFFWFCIGR